MRNSVFVVTTSLLIVAVIALLGLNSLTVRAVSFPDQIDLPDGFFPEGIAVGRGTDFYVGSLSDGSIYKGDLLTGEGAVLTDAPGQFVTVGIEVDQHERVWVAGGPSGSGRVYDGDTGELLASYTFTGPFESFVNDVLVTNDAAYFTDSGTSNDPDPAVLRFAGSPRLFVVPLGSGQILPEQSEVWTLPVNAPDIDFPNLNGIETTPGGSSLVVGHTVGEELFRVDPSNGDSTAIDIGGVPLLGNDGLIRQGNTIYVVENAISQVSAVKIAPDGSSGRVTAVYPVVGAETPTTADLFGNALYAVDARFASMEGPYKAFRVELR